MNVRRSVAALNQRARACYRIAVWCGRLFAIGFLWVGALLLGF